MMSAVRPILTSIPSPELSTLSPEQYELVRRKVLALVNIDLAHYKSRQMQRRLNALLTRSGKASWEEYFLHLERNPEALRSFKAYLTINVSRFFRDRPKWDHLAGQVLPELLQERRRLRIWSAGCSNGAEAYTLAMILHDLGAIDTGHYILATDIDTDVLEKAKQGGPYTREDVQEVPTHHLATHFDVEDEFYRVRPDLRARVRFRHHDLLNDPFEKSFDLIVCRNVVIYFTDEAKKTLYRRFADSLREGGILFVGGTETIPSLHRLPLRPTAISFYRKTDPR
jgi:chemotaxis protein methyltransferase CheR